MSTADLVAMKHMDILAEQLQEDVFYPLEQNMDRYAVNVDKAYQVRLEHIYSELEDLIKDLQEDTLA